MKQQIIEGTTYGVLTASTAYITVNFMGYNPVTLSALLYLYIISAILITAKPEIPEVSLPLLKRIVVVAEGEEMKLKKLVTGEEYKVNGEVEKL
ncbi:hypothetical protein [Candidatus Nanohalobium constans]|uniref:Uncharacterized protein n=1 Tax=Candidatus Nanohalobium constans TaxID=2565781 RepID=A0A5Q0UI76_9ARCH|nr:hypothetical protein [Candidatus Nanohalobium constans]QGA81041.1 hypothetical protein LC1Nh_1175 [Candidatus Nanohalobium constans]